MSTAKTTLRKAFSPAEWTTFTTKMPNWETDLDGCNKNTIFGVMTNAGLMPTGPQVSALLAHFPSAPTPSSIGKKRLQSEVDSSSLTQLQGSHPFVKFCVKLSSAKLSPSKFLSGIDNLEMEPSFSHGIYVRDSYDTMFQDIIKSKKPRAVITGTPGTGKTSFRYYLLWLWLTDDTSMIQFKTIHFDHGNSSYLLSVAQDGFVEYFKMANRRDWMPSYAFHDTLGLLEMCHDDQGIQFTDSLKLAIWTASPGAKDACGKEVCKMPRTAKWVLFHWSASEVLAVYGKSGVMSTAYALYGGVPRLLDGTSSQAGSGEFVNASEEAVSEAIDCLSTVFVSGIPLDANSRLAHRVLTLNSNGKPNGFTSTYVARLVYDKYKQAISIESKKIATTLSNVGWCNSVVGMFFEPAFHDHVIQQGSFPVHKTTIGVKFYDHLNSNRMKTPPVGLATLYIHMARQNDTFDSYILQKSATNVSLYLLQVTVGSTHSAGKWNGIVQVVKAAKATHKNISLHMVFIVPQSLKAFKKPGVMEGLPKKQPVSIIVQKAPFKFLADE